MAMLASSVLRVSFLALAISSCGSVQLPLTPAEVAQLQALGSRLDSEVSLRYDHEAVSRHQPNGTLMIMVERHVATAREAPFCGADSLTLQQQAATIASELLPQLRFNRYHSRITIIYDAFTPVRDNASVRLCSRVVTASLRTKRLVFWNHQGTI
jgi:hypothetical protein